jgi:hypothetical protein
VLNKVDYLIGEERAEAVDFLKRVLAEHLNETPAIHCLSARRALAAKLAADAKGVEDSGLKAIEEEVIVSLGAKKLRILEQAIAAKAMSALALARGEVSLALAALRMPIDELGRRLTAFEGLLPHLDRQRREVQDLLAGDRKRLVTALEEAVDKSRDRASDHFGRIIAAAVSAEPARAQGAACDAVAAAVPNFFESEFEEVSQEFAVHVTEIFRPHQQRATELIGSVRQKAADLFGIAPPVVQEVEGVELKRLPYWVSRDRVGSLIPRVAGRLEWLLPQAKKIQSLQRRLLDETMVLVLKNVENLRWSSLQNLGAALRRFSGDIDHQFTQAVEATRHAIATACSQRDEEAGKVSDDVRRIEHARLMLAEIETRLRALQSS